MPDGTVAIVCGRGHKTRYCDCGRAADFLCDWKMAQRKSGTRDKPICARHAKQVATDKHLCPEHQLKYDEWLKRHPDMMLPKNPEQQRLFTEAA